ncbi:MAG: hypothetical protein DWQ44_09960 [Bacteroidetes bacterium]|nr:MAG: hypothetical protein DWQ33_10235 [Bacteroidota bacterium]REK06604.1 MAG: hypothetical protein DWQ39_03750 [Bacteroidota bacterium]REK33370.1 MAG: hypothetical protein DWQ44_09960 [Bacteroidota bacterium]REK49769.1 MAG: hypothetical protein DWQ48_06515 [Bacteroidota bacterium]
MIKRLIPVLILIAAGLASCIISKDISVQNLSELYRPTEKAFHPQIEVFHQNDSLSRVFVKFHPDELLYVRQADNEYWSELRVNLRLLQSYESPKVLDTASCSFRFHIQEKGRERILFCDFPVTNKGQLLLEVFLNDVNKNLSENFYYNFDNLNSQSKQNFLVTDRRGIPLFKNYVEQNDSVMIFSNDTSRKLAFARYYYRNFPLPPPPFSFEVRESFDYKVDSMFFISINDSIPLSFPAEGFYHIQTDTTVKDGYTLFRHSAGFPAVNRTDKMLESIRYLTTKREFEEVMNNPSPRKAIDEFWYRRGGNEEKSKTLIRKYYTRVQDANRHFSSFVEGWKTDRGMIFIIFGSPNTVYRSSNSENWIYGSPNSALALNFFFTKANNPFSDNDFVLSRAPVYEPHWYRAVEVWRQGRAYNSLY